MARKRTRTPYPSNRCKFHQVPICLHQTSDPQNEWALHQWCSPWIWHARQWPFGRRSLWVRETWQCVQSLPSCTSGRNQSNQWHQDLVILKNVSTMQWSQTLCQKIGHFACKLSKQIPTVHTTARCVTCTCNNVIFANLLQGNHFWNVFGLTKCVKKIYTNIHDEKDQHP